MYDSPDHGLNTNAQIFEAVHAYLQLQNALFKHCDVCQYFQTGTAL